MKVPPLTQERARLNEGLPQAEGTTTAKRVNPAFIIGGLAVPLMCVMLLLFSRGHKTDNTALQGTRTPTRTPSATPANSPTPTPLALENQDKVIQGGDGRASSSIAYPVTLRIGLPGVAQPRVFVVQRRTIQTSQWDFDSNPDTASFVTGMTVRPVIGIPWSPENATLFANLGQKVTFSLQMNTGASLNFAYASSSHIARSDTSVLQQVGPALVLLLIGERDDNGDLTATRPMVLASYQPDGELIRDGVLVDALLGTPVPATATVVPTPVDRVDVQVVSVTSLPAKMSVTVTLRVFNSKQTPITIGPEALWVAFGYDPHPIGPRVPAEGLTPFETPFDLLPGQAVNLSVSFPWGGEPYASLGTDGLGLNGTYQFAVQLAAAKQG